MSDDEMKKVLEEFQELKLRVKVLEDEVTYLRKQVKQQAGFNSLNQKCR